MGATKPEILEENCIGAGAVKKLVKWKQ